MTNSPIVLSVSQLTQAIKLHLERQFPLVVVQGEISNFKKQSSNHLYFTLKDNRSQVQCAMFSSDASSLRQLPKNGDQVQLRGEINVYPPRGNYQIIVRSLQLAGLGQLLLQLQERKEKFLKLGWFDAKIKKKLPTFPKTIGVITSPTGAVISDILQILRRRAHGFHVILNPVKVQGEGAAKEIAQAIDDLNSHKLADVIIVGRGGGSLEDLWAFNEEVVVTSIYKSKIPVIAAIGHETDTTLADLAADVRAPTPSAAAELAISEKETQITFLNNCTHRLNQIMSHLIKQKKSQLQLCTRHPLIESPLNLLRIFEQKVDEMQILMDQSLDKSFSHAKEKLHKFSYRLQALSPEVQIQKKIHYLNQLKQKFDYKIQNLLQNKKNVFKNLCTHLNAIDPKNVLKKGYSILFDEKTNCAIVSSKDISLKQKLKLILTDGSCEAVVESVDCNNYEKRRS
ncbi:MAG: Exodeoxyribonuclease 7 large subunit [Chlamydiae bacterium]|nr:Exodeoxyribonuclease 7 large subunit [Chlamydiota bacterium]